MKRFAAILLAACLPAMLGAQEKAKTGWNFGPLPAVGYNSDLGFQYGALCDIFYYGDGSVFPDYRHKFNVEASAYTKGSGVLHFFYDSKYLIPRTRLTFAATYNPNRMMSFYGFNGFASPYHADLSPAFYAIDRRMTRVLADLQGTIRGRLGWAAGLSLWNYDIGAVTLDKYAGEPSLWQDYVARGIIRAGEAHGGTVGEVKAGLVWDTRDHEAAPSRGTVVELMLYGSPRWLNTTDAGYMKLALHLRQFVPLVPERLALAARVAYQGTVAGRTPWYMQQNIATLYLRQVFSEGLGGINTVRGVLYDRIVGDGYVWGNLELRWRMFDFRLFKQAWYLGLNPFADGGRVVQTYRLEEMQASGDPLIWDGESEAMHWSAGLGVKAVMNRNFVVSAEWGKPFDGRDGKNGMNIGLNYIF